MCCSAAKWKREEVPDHKFDFVDVNDFKDGSLIRRFLYLVLFALIIKNILVIAADVWTAYLLIRFNNWSRSISNPDLLKYGRWVFFASIIFSFLLILWELRKTARIVKSRDIAYAYTCNGAYRFYSIRSYAHFCLFAQINNSRRKTDRIAFFVYFTLKGWKRFLLAEAPRQVVNGIALFNVYIINGRFQPTRFYDNGSDLMARISFALMSFTFCVWAISAILLLIAGVLYLPLLCQIRGNLKEYVCHKIDKRLAELLRKKSRQRILEERREQFRIRQEMEAAGMEASLPAREPTLPQVGHFDLESAKATSAAAYPGGQSQLSPATSPQAYEKSLPSPVGSQFSLPPPNVPYGRPPSSINHGQYRRDSITSETSGYSQPRYGVGAQQQPLPPLADESRYGSEYSAGTAYGAGSHAYPPPPESAGSDSHYAQRPPSTFYRPHGASSANYRERVGRVTSATYSSTTMGTGNGGDNEGDDDDEPAISRYNDRGRYTHHHQTPPHLYHPGGAASSLAGPQGASTRPAHSQAPNWRQQQRRGNPSASGGGNGGNIHF